MNTPRIIKKYPNRRLYDTAISRYITLDDLKQLILSYTPFQVIDTQTEADITTSALLQIISELEQQGTPIFTVDLLQNLIRFYGNPLQANISQFLQQSMDFFVQQQSNLKAELNPFTLLQDAFAHNKKLWESWQKSFYKSANTNNNPDAAE